MNDSDRLTTPDHSEQDWVGDVLLAAVVVVTVTLGIVGIWLFSLAFGGLLSLFVDDLSKGLTPSHLLGVALLAMGVSSWLSQRLEQQSWRDSSPLVTELGKALLELLLILVVASLVASAVLAIVRTGLTPAAESSVIALELQLRRVASWLELLPQCYLLAAAAFAGIALVGCGAAALRVMGVATKVAAGLGALKTFLSVLLLVSLLATGVQSGAQAATARMLEQKQSLSGEGLKLHAAVQVEAERSVSRDIQQQLQAQPELAQKLLAWDAFARRHDTPNRRDTLRSSEQKALPKRVDTVDRLTAPALRRMRDEFSPSQVDEGSLAHKPVADMITKYSLEETLAEVLRKALSLHSEHPALELLASTFVNPLMVRSVRAEVERRTQAMLGLLGQGLTLAQMRELIAPSARLWVQDTLAPVAWSLAGALPPAAAAAAVPQRSRWDELRARLESERMQDRQLPGQHRRELIGAGIGGRDIGKEIDQMVRAQQDEAQLQQRPQPAAGVWDEAAFKVYLSAHPLMQLIWARAVANSESPQHLANDQAAVIAMLNRGLKAYYEGSPPKDATQLKRAVESGMVPGGGILKTRVRKPPKRPGRR